MPSRPKIQTAEEAAADRFAERIELAADRIAARQGPPPGTDKASDKDLRADWWTRDNKVDRQQLLGQLQQGIPQEMVGQYVIVRANPDLAGAYTQPVQDPERAQILAAYAEYPFRYGILQTVDDPEERHRLSERLKNQGPLEMPAPEQKALPEPAAATQAAPQTTPPAPAPVLPSPTDIPRPLPQAPADMPIPMMGG